MPTVSMPRADWDTVLLILNDAAMSGNYLKPVVLSLHDDIDNQVYSQEY